MILKMVDKLWEETKATPALLFSMLCVIGFSVWGWENYARADDLDGYVTKEEFSEVKTELIAVTTQVSINTAITENIYALSLAGEIREVHDQWCKSEDEVVRSILSNSINRLQNEYSDLKNSPYQIEACPN